MKVAIISDTHVKKHMDKFVSFVDKNLSNCDLIIHAGDFTNKKVIEFLKTKSKFIGVFGNNDKDDIRALLNEKEIIKLNSHKVGICHGFGDKNTQDNAYNYFKDDKVDLIIFGHSHKPLIETRKKILILNPGSISIRRREKYYSYIMLDIRKDFINAELKFINKL